MIGVYNHLIRKLVGGSTNPFDKNMLVNLDHFPKFRGENKKKYLSCHHLSMEFTGSLNRWYILPIGRLYATYHLLTDPETATEPSTYFP